MKLKTFALTALASTCAFSLASCVFGKKPDDKAKFDFSISLESGKTTLEVGDKDKVKIMTNLVDDVERVYTYETSNANRLTVDGEGNVYAVGSELGTAKITVTEEKSEISKTLELNIVTVSKLASGGFNYSAASGEGAIEKRTEILGKLEKYAIESHLTGITLFENGGYVKYNSRLEIPANEYITGYGFGILSEGDIKADLEGETVPEYKRYYHSAQTSNPNTINAWNATGSQVSDLSSYITSTYWGTRMTATKDGYEWYPVLAKDTVNGQPNNRPVPVYDKVNPLGLYKTWKIYVKTAADGLKYRAAGASAGFDNRGVALEDYAFTFQVLLTGANKMTRGAEMAGDKTYGIRGAQAYYNRTKEMTDQTTIDNLWKEMTLTNSSGVQDPAQFKDQQLGIMTGTDAGGSYIQLELLNEIDAFTAMYTLSSSLYSPIPRAFMETISGGSIIKGVQSYGKADSSSGRNIVDNTISLGAYKLDVWNNSYLAFGRNDTWFETVANPDKRYKIPGIKITTYDNATQEQLYQYFYSHLLDSCGIPVDHIGEEQGKPDVRSTKGDSTFKLNVNSCTQERWNELFGSNGKITKNSSWDVKPWMSNENFLNGLYWSINREQFASNKGMQPSIDYFSNAYLSDPENGISYNDSQAHKQATAKWHTVRTVDGKTEDNYGYDYSKAVSYFKNAVNELAANNKLKLGTVSKPTEINIHIRWMYQTDINDYGNEIKTYFEDAFNDPDVCGKTVKLVVKQDAVTNWEDVYNEYMMKGQFDLAFGAISGNTYNPLNFLEVLKSDNSSGFTLNWGPDTGAVDTKNPLIYDGNKWSFDALWEVTDRGGVVDNGVSVKTVKSYNFDGLAKKISDGKDTNDYSVGVTQSVNLEFVELEGVGIDVTKVQVYTVGGVNTDVTSFTYDPATKKLSLTISAADAAALKAEMVDLNNKGKTPGDQGYVSDPFTRSNYGTYWTLEIYYNLSILGGTPSESYVTVALTAADQA